MGTGRPVAPISKVREVQSGLSITINTEGAVIDAYVITADPPGSPPACGAGSREVSRPVVPHRQPARRRRPRRAPAARRPSGRCARTGCEFRVDARTRLEHARELAARGARRGRARRRAGRRRARSAPSPARCAAPTRCSACSPAGAATTSRASSGIPRDPVARPATCSPTARERAIDVADVGGQRVRRHRRARASTPTPTASPTRRRPGSASSSTSTARCARSRRGARRASSSTIDGAPPRVHRLQRRGGATRASSAAACTLAPDAKLDDGAARRRASTARLPKRRFLRSAAEGLQGHARRASPSVDDRCARARSRISADRPFAVYADGDPIADLPVTVGSCPARCACCAAVSAAARRSSPPRGPSARSRAPRGRGGGTSLPGKVLMRLEPHAIGRLARAPRARQRR